MSGLIGWWPLHEHAGQANDLSGNDNHGTNSSVTQGVAGKGGLTAYSFDGSNSNIDIPNDLTSSSDPITVSFWARFNAPSDGNTDTVLWLRNGDDVIIRTDGSGNLDFDFNNGTVSGSVSADTWHHVVCTRDGSGNIEMFLDDSSQGTDSSGTDSFSQDCRIGAKDSGSIQDVLNGALCDVRLYDRVLSSSEISTLHDWGNGDYANPPGNSDGGELYWKLDESSGDASDSWNSHTGSVSATQDVSDAIRNTCYSFDGSSNTVNTSSDFNIWSNGEATITAWVKWISADGSSSEYLGGHGADNNNQLNLLNRNGNWGSFFQVGGSNDIITGPSINTGEWRFMAATVDSSEHKLYINAVEEASSSHGMTPSNIGSGEARLGARAGDNVNNSNAKIDDFRIYNKKLEQWEIQEIYQYGTKGRDMRVRTVIQ